MHDDGAQVRQRDILTTYLPADAMLREQKLYFLYQYTDTDTVTCC